MIRSSQDLLARATNGDDEAVEELLVRHLDGLRAFVRLRAGAIVRKRERESDIVQSVCREVLNRAASFRYGGEAGFRHWLYTTALRKILNKRDRHVAARRDVLREDAPARDGPDAALLVTYRSFSSPSQAAVSAEELARIEAAFESLPADYREAIVLSRVVGLSRTEVAAEMDRSEASVRNLVHRGLARLSQLLEQRDGGAGSE